MFNKNRTAALTRGGTPTAQEKMVNVNDNQGNPNAKNGQGTTFTIYDSLALNGVNVFEFFKGSQNRDFPLTNVDGTLQAGETTTVQSTRIQFYEYTNLSTGDYTVVNIQPLQSSLQFQNAEFDLLIATQTVVQKIPLNEWIDIYNDNSMIVGQSVFFFKTNLVIPPFLKFTFRITLWEPVTVANTVARMTVKGAGGIFAAKANF